MKKIIFLTICLFSFIYLNAQEKEDEPKTLFGNKEYNSGGYGCPDIKLTQLSDQFAIMVGGRGGWVIDHSFSIGGGGYGLVTSVNAPEGYLPDDLTDDREYYLQLAYGGLFLEYIYSPNSLIHFTVNTLIGAGGTTLTPYRNGMNNGMGYSYDYYDNSAFFVVEPGIGVELNVLKFFRIELGASYRVLNGLELPDIENSFLSGPSANLAFKFGSF